MDYALKQLEKDKHMKSAAFEAALEPKRMIPLEDKSSSGEEHPSSSAFKPSFTDPFAFTSGIIQKLFWPVEAKDEVVMVIFLNPTDASVLRFSPQFLVESQMSLRRQGVYGLLFEANVHVSSKIPRGHGVALTFDDLAHGLGLSTPKKALEAYTLVKIV